MDSQRGGEPCSDLLEAEAEFRQTHLRLTTEGASDEERARQLLRSPFVEGLLIKVTGKNELKTKTGARTPELWWVQLRRDDDLRDEWRSETFVVLGCRLLADPKQVGDPEKNLGAFWRVKILYAAIRAAWNLLGKNRFKSRYDPESEERVVPIKCFSESGTEKAHERHEDKGAAAGLVEMEVRLDVAMLIDALDDPREREVMRLSEVEGYDYPEIAAKLGISFENVRGAVERAREALLKRLGIDQAKLIDGLEDPRQRAVMRLAAMKYKHEKIAAELGISKEQVQSDVKQARKVLQDRLRWVLLKRLRLVA